MVPLHRFLSIMCLESRHPCQRSPACSRRRARATSRRSSKGRQANVPRRRNSRSPKALAFWCATPIARSSACWKSASPPYGLKRGQWYFLRVLWTEDGLSQRELSARVGTMEPTTVIALRSMERVRPDPPRPQHRRQAQGAGVADAEGQATARRTAVGRARHHRRGRTRRQPHRVGAVPPRHRAHDRQSRPDQD